MSRQRALICGAAALLAWSACAGEDSSQGDDAYARGQKIYKNVCIACHNPDPSLKGSLGPPIAGSPRELIEARVVRGIYPEDYEPKMPGSMAMPAFPHLAGSVDDITAFLNDDRDSD